MTLPPTLAQQPLTYVDWHDVNVFCAWAGVRRPSEAEWEKAARGDDGRPLDKPHSQFGTHYLDLETPALLVNLVAMECNLRLVAGDDPATNADHRRQLAEGEHHNP